MLSIPKLLLLAIVVGAVWYGFKYLQARDRALARAAADAAVRQQAQRPTQHSAQRTAAATEELAKCPVCATYVAPGARACGRAGCPHV